MQVSQETLGQALQFTAILMELAVTLLVAVLFLLIRRYAPLRAYFATWTTAWLWMAIAIGAVAVRYDLLPETAQRELPESSPFVHTLYIVYQAGKVLFWTLVARGAFEYARPDLHVRRWWTWAALAYAVLTTAFQSDLNLTLVWQAPVAVSCCAAAALWLFELPPARRSVGSVATGAVLGAAALLWGVYFVVFAGAAHVLPDVAPSIAGEVTQYNSYVDGLVIVMLGYAMIVLFMEDARLRLSESESRLAALAASAADAIVTTDIDFRLLDANNAAERMFGIRREFAMGTPVDALIAPEDRPRLRAALDSLLHADATAVAPGERTHALEAVRADGRRFTLEATASRLRSNSTMSLALVMRDVTERRELEERQRQVEKMDAVRQLAGGLAHDFNNLLTAIVGRSQILARTVPADSAVREGILEVERTAGAAARLTRGLLALSRREALHPERVPLNTLVRSLEGRARAAAGPDVAVAFRYAHDAGDVTVDVTRLEAAILGAVLNAREAATGARGQVEIETTRLTRRIESGRNVETACVSIRDSGPGFGADARAHLFEPFFSTKGDGRGLGLATTYAFLQQSGGWTDVESGSHGTTVRLALPIAHESAHPPPREATPRAERPSGPAQPTVLVAEDEETVRRFVRVVLEREGFRVLEAENGMDALAAFESADPPVDVLLTDVVMPQMGGRELAERVVAARPAVRVIFMSGFVKDDTLLEGLTDRTVPFLQKPFDIEELARMVRAEIGVA